MSDAWVQVAGTALGGLLALVGGFAGQLMAPWVNRKSREIEQDAHREREQADFQRTTLLALQDAMLDVLHHDAFAFASKHSDDQEKLVTPEFLDRYLRASFRIKLLLARLQDDQLRSLVEEFVRASLEVSSLPVGSAMGLVEHQVDHQSASFNAAQDRIGVLLRSPNICSPAASATPASPA